MRKIQGRNGGTLYLAEKGETNNPNGRPPKLITHTIKQLKEAGVEPASRSDIVDLYMQLINASPAKLRELSQDDAQSALVHLVAMNILEGKGYEVMETMLDRAIGKSTQMIEQKTEITGSINLDALPDSNPLRKVLESDHDN